MWIGFHPRAALPRQVPLRTRTARRARHTRTTPPARPGRGVRRSGSNVRSLFFDNNTSHRSATARAANRLESTLQRSVYTAQRRDEPMSIACASPARGAVNQHASQEIAIRSVNTYTYLRCRAPGSRLSARGGRAVLLAPRYEHHPWPCADLPPLGRVAPLHMHCRASVACAVGRCCLAMACISLPINPYRRHFLSVYITCLLVLQPLLHLLCVERAEGHTRGRRVVNIATLDARRAHFSTDLP